MAEWFGNLIAVVAVLSVVGLVFAAGQWVGRVNSHISGVSALLKEIRFGINEILGRLPPVAIAEDSPLNPDQDQNTPHRSADGVRTKLTESGLTEADIADAVAWARSDE